MCVFCFTALVFDMLTGVGPVIDVIQFEIVLIKYEDCVLRQVLSTVSV